MKISHQANGYHSSVWFSEISVTDNIALRNLHLQYLFTYRIDEMMFIVHRKYEGKPNMQFIMHESGMHCFEPRDQEFSFVNTVSDNKESFIARKIKGEEVDRYIYTTLIYPSAKYYK